MPYIKQEDRDFIDGQISMLVRQINTLMRLRNEDQRGGVLNYTITKLMLGTLPRETRYVDYATAVSAVECAKLEFYRRHVAPYEDEKIALNGDVTR